MKLVIDMNLSPAWEDTFAIAGDRGGALEQDRPGKCYGF